MHKMKALYRFLIVAAFCLVTAIPLIAQVKTIQAATIISAELLGWKDKVGSITAGKFADIVAVSPDPLQKTSVLENVEFVMKGGVVYKNLLAKSF